MAETEPTKQGLATSEGKLTLVVIVLGTVLEAVGAVLHAFQDAGAAAPWFPSVLAAIGALLTVASALGYQRSRSFIKATMIATEAPTQALPPK
jgi:hypothetical protein